MCPPPPGLRLRVRWAHPHRHFISAITSYPYNPLSNIPPETQDIQEYRFTHLHQTYILIDTPGFDDTHLPNSAVVHSLLSWLSKSFRAGTRLNGILYLHRISDTRMTGSAYENLRMFRSLVGDAALPNVLLVTTFWDTVPRSRGEANERELVTKPDFWGRMVGRGSRVFRLPSRDARGEALSILLAVRPGKVTLQAQIEMVLEGKSAGDTAAATALLAELEIRLEEDHARFKQRVQERDYAETVRLGKEKVRLEREWEEVGRRERERGERADAAERGRIEEERRRWEGVMRGRRRELEERMERVRGEVRREVEEDRRVREELGRRMGGLYR